MNRKGKPCGEGQSFGSNRSGNRSNDRAERSLRTITARPGLNRSIAGGEGNSASLRSRSAGSWRRLVGKSCVTMTYGAGRVIVRGNRSGNRSAYSMAFVPKGRKLLFLWGKSNRSV